MGPYEKQHVPVGEASRALSRINAVEAVGHRAFARCDTRDTTTKPQGAESANFQ
ncbi:conserved hypothetical protein [Ricinus communis]|uniref:Uncharacterized protein n=1 Tax=Ricinus communis TaxID=3988 RepID=B9RYL1_RICCO|nr:conserved hypothetical protein [Ricinus communis]